MTREEILALCHKTRDVCSVKHVDFADYIVVLESRRRVEDEWQLVEHAYMQVEGKLAMANEDHRKQGKRLDFAEPKVLIDNAEQLTLQVTVTSEVYGVRHGIATSRKKSGISAERDFPWEVAETSAMGRALAAMGYGLLPGTGSASAEDVVLGLSKDMLRAIRTMANIDENNNHPSTNSGNHFCTVHQVPLQARGKGWAHLLKSGGWCFGKSNGAGQGVSISSNGEQHK